MPRNRPVPRLLGPTTPWSISAIALALAAVLLAGAVALGLRARAAHTRPLFARAGAVDYTAFLDGIAPLADGFVEDVLGGLVPVEPPRGDGGPSGSGDGAVDEAPDLDEDPPLVAREFTNDDFADAAEIDRVPYGSRTYTAGATREPGEPGSCALQGGTAWFRLHATRGMAVTADTFGSGYRVALAVFRGSSLRDLDQRACDRSSSGDAEVGFRAEKGATYHLQVTGTNGSGVLAFRVRRAWNTDRVSVGSGGAGEEGDSQRPSVSADGRFVAFTSYGAFGYDGLCQPRAICRNVFVRDRLAGTTELVSVSTSGAPADNISIDARISANGRYVAFTSIATNLVPQDTLGTDQVYVRDLVARTTTLVSVHTSGRPSRQYAEDVDEAGLEIHNGYPTLSADGTRVAWMTATDLAPRDRTCRDSFTPELVGVDHRPPRQCFDIVLHDMTTGVTEIVSRTDDGRSAPGDETIGSISATGGHVVFLAEGSLTSSDPNPQTASVYLRDLATRRTMHVSLPYVGDDTGYNFVFQENVVSADGRYVVFASGSPRMAPGDRDRRFDVFVRDMRSGTNTLVSVSSSGVKANSGPGATDTDGNVQSPSISLDGRYVAFDSDATNLAPGDDNQVRDVFVRDLLLGRTRRASVSTVANEGDGASSFPTMCGSGLCVAFESVATNLDDGDANGASDVFVHAPPEI